MGLGKMRQPIAYLLVGVWNTAFGVGLYTFGFWWLEKRVHYMVILAVANAIAISNAFVCHKLLVFRTDGRWVREYTRFTVVYGANAILGIGIVALLVQALGMDPLHASWATTVALVGVSYLAHKKVTFARSGISRS